MNNLNKDDRSNNISVSVYLNITAYKILYRFTVTLLCHSDTLVLGQASRLAQMLTTLFI